jgi:DNA-binding GntR family transcriptional regulator
MAERIAADLRRAILTGEIPPGSKLNQLKLAEELNVSTTPVREALRLLESQGLVRIDTYSGATVPVPSLADLASLYRIRLALCPLVAQSVVSRATAEQLERARLANRSLEAAGDNGAWIEANQQLHAILDEAIEDRHLSQLWRELSALSTIYVTLSLPYRADARRGAHDEHVRLIEAYGQGDAVRIEQALVEHLTHTYEGCRDAMAAVPDGHTASDLEGAADTRLIAAGERRMETT